MLTLEATHRLQFDYFQTGDVAVLVIKYNLSGPVYPYLAFYVAAAELVIRKLLPYSLKQIEVKREQLVFELI